MSIIKYVPPVLSGITEDETVSVPSIVYDGGRYWTVPELLFEKKGLIPDLQQLLVC